MKKLSIFAVLFLLLSTFLVNATSMTHSELARKAMINSITIRLARKQEQARRQLAEREAAERQRIEDEYEKGANDLFEAFQQASADQGKEEIPVFENFSANSEKIFQSMLSKGRSRLSVVEEVEREKRRLKRIEAEKELFEAYDVMIAVIDAIIIQYRGLPSRDLPNLQ
ncbi:hypothetical protein ACFLXW_00025 [Candidatus Dependentiae bacterium]